MGIGELSIIAGFLHINKKRWTVEEENLLKGMYPHELDKLEKLLLNRNRKSIISKAGLMGLSKKNNSKFTPLEDKILIENYPSNGGKYVQTLLPNRKLSEIYNRAFKLGVAHLTYNKNYFSVINSHEKAYWLGFIYADGYITEKTYRFGIELNINDKDHLQNFLNCIESNMKIRTRTRKNRFENKQQENINSCSIIINNKKLHSDLKNLGVQFNKSKTLKFPTNDILPKEYHFSFLRGVIDGDGTIGIYNCKNNHKKPHISVISGSKEFIISLKNILKENEFTLHLRKQSNGTYRLMSESKETVISLLQSLYKDSKIHTRLKRKYNNYIEIVKHYGVDTEVV